MFEVRTAHSKPLKLRKVDPVLYFEDVSFSYPNRERLMKNLSFRINQGDFVSLVGPNGSGKSTVAKLMNGLLQPDQGRVVFEGLDTLNKDDVADIRKSVGIVFQNPEDQMVATTVMDEILFGLENIRCPPEEMLNRVEDSLKRVGMVSYKDHEPHELSGGQKQRVAVAAILAMKPKLIVFDESTSMLDPKGRKQILEIMRHLHQEGFTIVNITHHMEEVFISSQVLLIHHGELVMKGTPLYVFNHPEKVLHHRLELPFVIKVREMLVDQGFDIPKDVLSIERLVDRLWKYR